VKYGSRDEGHAARWNTLLQLILRFRTPLLPFDFLPARTTKAGPEVSVGGGSQCNRQLSILLSQYINWL
jgi:hypothetical protein